MGEIRHNWTQKEVLEIYDWPLMDLLYRAASIHRERPAFLRINIRI